MKIILLKEMLLIDEPSALRLYEEMMRIASMFVAPVFLIALILEYFGEMDFGSVVRKLLIVTISMSIFYQIHTEGVRVSLEGATDTLQKVSPKNLFVKKWYETKVKTKDQKSWSFLESIAIPNLNDIIVTTFFLLAKVFIWFLKLIYSTVYHLTYIFSGVTAILYFLGWTKDSLKGAVQASLWCMLMPFVVVAILALVGNSLDESAATGTLIIAKVDTIIWLFGVTLLLLLTPLITFGLVKGDGIHSFGSKLGSMVVKSGFKVGAAVPLLVKIPDRARSATRTTANSVRSISDRATKLSASIKEGFDKRFKEKGENKLEKGANEQNTTRLESNKEKTSEIKGESRAKESLKVEGGGKEVISKPSKEIPIKPQTSTDKKRETISQNEKSKQSSNKEISKEMKSERVLGKSKEIRPTQVLRKGGERELR